MTVNEYFIVSNSFAAPFFSDQDTSFITAETPAAALESFAKNYKHPCGLFSANCYASANDYHKGSPQLAQWLCNHEIEKQKLTAEIEGYSYLGISPGVFEINGKRYHIENPKEGRVL